MFCCPESIVGSFNFLLKRDLSNLFVREILDFFFPSRYSYISLHKMHSTKVSTLMFFSCSFIVPRFLRINPLLYFVRLTFPVDISLFWSPFHCITKSRWHWIIWSYRTICSYAGGVAVVILWRIFFSTRLSYRQNPTLSNLLFGRYSISFTFWIHRSSCFFFDNTGGFDRKNFDEANEVLMAAFDTYTTVYGNRYFSSLRTFFFKNSSIEIQKRNIIHNNPPQLLSIINVTVFAVVRLLARYGRMVAMSAT